MPHVTANLVFECRIPIATGGGYDLKTFSEVLEKMHHFSLAMIPRDKIKVLDNVMRCEIPVTEELLSYLIGSSISDQIFPDCPNCPRCKQPWPKR